VRWNILAPFPSPLGIDRAVVQTLTEHSHTNRSLPTPGQAAGEPVFLGSELFARAAFPGNHPLNIIRHSAVLELVRLLGWLDDEHYLEIAPVPVARLLEFHDPGYVEALQYADAAGIVERPVRERYNLGTLENPLFAGMFDRARATVGGSIAAAELALAGHAAFHPSGGTHHGRPDRAVGFCYFNDLRTLLDGGLERVAYIDLDAHHGDGVEAAFADDPRVATLSIHEVDRWPYSGQASEPERGIYNLPVPRGLNDSELDFLVENVVLPVLAMHRADGLVLCCGADCLDGDPLSGMTLSNVSLSRTVEALLALGVPSVVLGGGGYNPWTLTRYWAGLWATMTGQELPASLPPAAVAMLDAMECDLVDEEDRDPKWLTTMADTPYSGPVRDPIRYLAASVMAR
jgi:acetoin utilization protein AcuC